jgi:Tol biopolymer transport system component
MYDIARTTLTPLVSGWDNLAPVWSPDGRRIAFNSNQGAVGGRNLFWQTADGTSAPERLMPDTPSDQYAEAWSPNGRVLVFSQSDRGTDSALWTISVDDRNVRRLHDTTTPERAATISPDGRWIAYESDASGRREIYVQAFPGPSRTWQVSLDGGRIPVWSPNGRELFYRRGVSMMAADITEGPELRVGTPKQLFAAANWWGGRPQFDVAPDGRFVLINFELARITQLALVQNWNEELKRLVPTAGK